jgi:ribosomal protein L34E
MDWIADGFAIIVSDPVDEDRPFAAGSERLKTLVDPPYGGGLSLDDAHGPFQCPECDLKFNTINGLKIHRARMHHDPVRAAFGFTCTECGREFKTEAGLISHRNWPHKRAPERPFACKECDRAFTTAVGLSVHHSNMHPGVPHPTKAAASPAKIDPVVLRREELLRNNRRYMGKDA